jgi:hypothetical protein
VKSALFTFLGLSLLVVSNAEGQKNCRKGNPCGNTCIAANKVCHIGTPSTPPTTSGSDSAPVVQKDSMAWVASSRGHTYYRMQDGEPPLASKPDLLPHGRGSAAGGLSPVNITRVLRASGSMSG